MNMHAHKINIVFNMHTVEYLRICCVLLLIRLIIVYGLIICWVQKVLSGKLCGRWAIQNSRIENLHNNYNKSRFEEGVQHACTPYGPGVLLHIILHSCKISEL